MLDNVGSGRDVYGVGIRLEPKIAALINLILAGEVDRRWIEKFGSTVENPKGRTEIRNYILLIGNISMNPWVDEQGRPIIHFGISGLLEAEVGGTAAELAKLEEQGIEVSIQLGEVFTQKARVAKSKGDER